MRPSGRQLNELRPVTIETGVTRHAEGSCLIRMGGTIVPFVNTIPRDTALYRLMSTTPGDDMADK